MRIATWNVNSLGVRLPRVEEWIAYAEPDVLCLQETKMADTAFPAMAFSALGYEAAHHGDGRWNGVAIVSRVGLDDVVAGFAPEPEPEPVESRLVSATCGGVRVHSVYVPNGRTVGGDHYEAKLRWLTALRSHLSSTSRVDDDVVVCGDFNVAPEDRDVWDPKAFTDSTHVTAAERHAIEALIDWGLVDAFRQLRPEDGLFTWWDYRAGNFHKRKGMRIDLMLVSPPVANRLQFTLIDRNARKGKLPSDHAPMFIDLEAR
ncbi:MAG: exodeoxyribonuclease III [Acidimicrobiales bacterium]